MNKKNDNGMPINIFLLDLSKLFDRLSHTLLLDTLYFYGIRGIPLNLCKSYLTDSSYFFKIHHAINLFTNHQITLYSYYVQLSAMLFEQLCTVVHNVMRHFFDCLKLRVTKRYYYSGISVYGHPSNTVTMGQSQMISTVKDRTLVPLIQSPRYSRIRSVTQCKTLRLSAD